MSNNEGFTGVYKINKSRLVGFSDGVLAIVVTLMVLGIDVPSDHKFDEDHLISFLIKLEPSLVAYFTSFLLVCVYWMQHYLTSHYLKHTNANLIWLNVFFLMFVSLLPFLSKLKALYPYELIVVTLFALTHIICGLSLFLIWRYLLKHAELLNTEIDKKTGKWVSKRFLFVPLTCLVSIIISFFNVHIGTYIFLLIPLFLIYNTIVRNRTWQKMKQKKS